MAKARQIRAGRAYVELGVEDRLTRGLRAAQRRLEAFGAQVRRIGMRIAALGAGILAPLAGSVRHFQQAGDRLDKLAQRTGFTVETLSELGFAAELAGADLNALETGIRRMQQTVFDAERGLSTAADALDVMGLASEDLRGKTPEQQFRLMADGLASINDPSIRAAVALQVFGRAGQQLLPLLSRGSEGIEAFQQQARDLGLTVSTEAAEAAAKFNDKMTTLRRVVQRAIFTMGHALIPTVSKLVERVTEVAVASGAWIGRNRHLVVWAAKLGAALVATGLAIIGFGLTLSLVGASLGALAGLIAGTVKALALLKVGILALVSPIGLVIAAVGALGAYLVHTTDIAGKALRWLSQRFGQLRDFAIQSFRAIGDALAAGDIALAARILWLSLRRAWIEGTNWLRRMWIDFRAEFNRIAAQAFFGAADIAVRAFGAIQRAWVRVRDFFRETFHEIRTGFRAAMEGRRVDAEVEALRARLEAGEITEQQFRQQFTRLMRDGLKRNQQLMGEHHRAMDRINEENERDLAQINQRQAERLESIGEMLVDAMDQLERGRDQALEETDQKLAEAQREWREAIAEAREARKAIGDVEGVDGPERLRSPAALFEQFEDVMARLRGAAERTIEVRGTFSAAAIQGLAAAGNTDQRIARATEQTARHTRSLDRKVNEQGQTFG